MGAFDSTAKKLAIPMIVLFEIGWIIYIGGFGSYMHQLVLENADNSFTSQTANEILRNPVLFSYYFTVVGGQFVALLFLFHALLPSSTASYIVGVLSSVMSVIYFVSVGYLIHWSVASVRFYEDRVSSLQQSSYFLSSEALTRAILYLHAARCVLAGTILMTISWGLIQLLFFFYEPQTDSQNQRNLWRVIREFATDLTTSTSQAKLGELLQICTIPLLVISVIGWCVCVAGLYKLFDAAATSSYTITNSHQYDFGTWAVFFATPLLYLAALLHAGCAGGASTMSGVFAAILNTFFVLNMGSAVVSVCVGKYLLDQSTSSVPAETTHNFDLILGGGVVCLLFWTITYAAWHFYRCKGSTDHGRLQPNQDDDHAQIVSHAAQQNEYGDTSFVPEQLPPYAKHREAEMQPVN